MIAFNKIPRMSCRLIEIDVSVSEITFLFSRNSLFGISIREKQYTGSTEMEQSGSAMRIRE